MTEDHADGAGRPEPESRARTHLANERTFLAWFRTGFTLIALGVAASQFLGTEAAGTGNLARLLGGATVAGGTLLVVGGFVRYRSAREAIDAVRFEPAGRSIDLSVAMGLVVGLVALGFVLLASPA